MEKEKDAMYALVDFYIYCKEMQGEEEVSKKLFKSMSKKKLASFYLRYYGEEPSSSTTTAQLYDLLRSSYVDMVKVHPFPLS